MHGSEYAMYSSVYAIEKIVRGTHRFVRSTHEIVCGVYTEEYYSRVLHYETARYV